MTQRLVWPHEQFLCTTVQLRHVQNSHQIHLRWFTSRMKRATIQRRICVCVTASNVSAAFAELQWAERPRLFVFRSHSIRDGAALGVAAPSRAFVAYSRAPRPRPMPPAKRLISQI